MWAMLEPYWEAVPAENNQDSEGEEFDSVSKSGDDIESESNSEGEGEGEESSLPNSAPEIRQGWNFVFSSTAFKGLQSRLRNISLLTLRDRNVQEFRKKIIERLESIAVTMAVKGGNVTTYDFSCTVSWDPLSFLKVEYGATQPAIHEVVTITGDAADAQATTCGRYISQVWPENGEALLQEIQSAILEPQKWHTCIYLLPHAQVTYL